MSFTTYSTFYTNYWSLGPVQVPTYGTRLSANEILDRAGHAPVCGEQPGVRQKATDDTSITQLQLETEIEALKEKLVFMKNHEEELKGLQAQIASSGLTMEVDAPKFQDLTEIMADIRAQYDKVAW
ncbi:Keratin, type I cytoskeletal 18 [Saguinus oedipus]|uniref:Keratin, type I cytoskeletal 18 n=1 Tax=Saguinus oedipus TaxID=9490 RepID=A0ABQ9UHK7_SAGOE|nr:Keratin, type I cytoskeletal 18 [Saguinus oedipus]